MLRPAHRLQPGPAGRGVSWLSTCSSGHPESPGRGAVCHCAFPSACGKTNLAMLIPPEGYQKNGWKCWCVGDDIAWLRVGADGRLWAVNPEKGFFGVAPGTNAKSNPNALATTHQGTIFTNVALNLEDDTVWWGGYPNPPQHAWTGRATPGARTLPPAPLPIPTPASPPRRRIAPASPGVCCTTRPISAIIFGGRRAKTAPLVYQSRDWQHGVFVGSVGLEKNGRCRRHRGGNPPGSHGHAALLRLPHGGLLAALAGYGEGHCQPAENLQRRLVPHR